MVSVGMNGYLEAILRNKALYIVDAQPYFCHNVHYLPVNSWAYLLNDIHYYSPAEVDLELVARGTTGFTG